MIFEKTIQNHNWNGILIPKCFARCDRAEIHDNQVTTETEYFSVIGEDQHHLTNIRDTFPIDVDQPLRPQILAYFARAFGG